MRSGLGKNSADGDEFIPLSVPEIRRLVGHFVAAPHHHANEHHLHWSRFRRRSQARARKSHYERRGHNSQMRSTPTCKSLRTRTSPSITWL
ncbi:hypothetical protein HEP87_63590 [Streptomyces sp. S1D4-11]